MVNVIGHAILEALDRLGRTQTWLAEEVGVSNTAVTKWIDTGDISRQNAVKVAAVLGISLDKLILGKTETPSEKIGEAIDALPATAVQEVLDFIRFKYERAEEFIAQEPAKWKDYIRMIEKIRADYDAKTRKPEADGS